MTGSLSSIVWSDAEPQVLERDRAAIPAIAPDLVYQPPEIVDGLVVHHGLWVGRLPVWPFDRIVPEGLPMLVSEGASIVMRYSAAHPMVPPRITVTDPEPELDERTQHRWHVAPGGSLCLLQTDGDWTPETSAAELLLKAAGWRIEYALMKAGLVDSMTTSGIVTDASRDPLIVEAASR